MQMHTYHIYWKDRPIFKNLEEDDFFMIWEKIMHLYNDELSYVRLKGSETADLETSH